MKYTKETQAYYGQGKILMPILSKLTLKQHLFPNVVIKHKQYLQILFVMRLRGGGAVCRIQTNIEYTHEDKQHQIVKEITSRCEIIKTSSFNIGKSHELIDREIQWFIRYNQIIHNLLHQNDQFNNNQVLLLSQTGFLKRNLIIILEAIKNLIDSQIYLVQLLNICNLFSRLIIRSQETLTKDQDNVIINQHLDYISSFLEFKNHQFKGINQYHIMFIRMCIQGFQFQKLQSKSWKFIFQSLNDFANNPEIINYKQISIQEEQISFYIEEMKSILIHQYENGAEITQIKSQLNQVYVEFVQSSDQLTTKLCWAKIISEIISYQPYISQTKYNQLLIQHQIAIDWKQAINKNLIIHDDQNSQYGLIQCNSSNLNWEIFNKKIRTLEQLKSSLIEGYKSIPRLDDYINQSEEMNYEYREDISDKKNQFYHFIDSLIVDQIQTDFQKFSLKFYNCNKVFQELLAVKINRGQQIQQFQRFSGQLFDEYKKLDYNSKILSLQILNLCQSDGQIVHNLQSDKYYFYCIFQDIFSVLKEFQQVQNFNIYINELIKITSNINLDIISNNEDEISLIRNQINDQNYDIDLILNFIENQAKCYNTNEKLNSRIILNLNMSIQKQIQSVFEKDLRALFQYYELIEIIEIFKHDQLIDKLQKMIFMSQFYISFKQHSYYLIRKLIKEQKFTYQLSLQINLNDLLKMNLEQISLEFEDIIIKKNIVSDFHHQIQGQSNSDRFQQWIQILEYLENLSPQIQKQFQIKKSQLISQINIIIENPQDIKLKEIQLKLELMQNAQKLKNFLDNQEDITQIQILLKHRVDLIQIYLTQINDNEQVELLLLREIDQYFIWLHQKESKQSFRSMIHKMSDNQQLIQKIFLNQSQQINQCTIDYNWKTVHMLESQISIIEQQQIQLQESSLETLKQYQNIYLNNQINDEIYLQLSKILKSNFELKVQNLDYFFQSLNGKIEQQMAFMNNQQIILIKQSMIQSLFPFDTSQSLKNVIELQNTARSFQTDQIGRIREYFFLQSLYSYKHIIEESIQEKIGSIIIIGILNETDIRILEIFDTKHFNSLFLQFTVNNWDDIKNNLYQKLQTSLVFLQRLQSSYQQASGDEQKLLILQYHQKFEQELDQKLRNIHYIEQLYKIDFYFIHDVQRNLQTFKKQLDQYLNASEQIQNDFNQFKLISPQQLMETYYNRVLQTQEIWNFKNFNIQQSVGIFNYNIQSEENEKSHIFSYQNKQGEIQKFLNERNLSILLINGTQGSGKSFMAKQIEEYLLKEYFVKVNNQKWESLNQQIFIPIFIKAPNKENHQGIIEYTLQTHYKFDNNQIDQFRQVVQNSDKINLVFIIDDYIQLGKQFNQTNWIQGINMNQWKFQNQQQNPKVIITQTCEQFQKLDDVKQLYCDQYTGFQSILQVRLLPFSEFKREEFIEQFCWHQVKLQIVNLFDLVSSNCEQKQKYQKILEIQQQIKEMSNITIKSKYLLEKVQQQQIISVLKQDIYLQNITTIHQEYFLKQICKIWCHHQYMQVIVNLNQQHLLKVPFMFSIILSTLPQILDQSDLFNISKKSYDFYQIYLQNKLQEQQFINQYQNQYQLVNEQEIQKQNPSNPEQLIEIKKQRLLNLKNLKDQIKQEEDNLNLEIQLITQQQLNALGQIQVQQNMENISQIYPQDQLNFNGHMQFDWNEYISTCQISQNKQFLVIGGFEKKLQIYDLDTKQRIHSVVLENIVKISKFTLDSKFVILGDEQGYLYQYQVHEFKELYRQKVHQSQISDLVLLDNDSILTCSYDKSIILMNLPQNKQLLKIQNMHTHQIRGIDYDLHQSLIVSCSDDKLIKVFDLKNGEFLFQQENAHTLYIQQVQFIANDQLISSNINDLFLWQIDHNQKQLRVIRKVEQQNYNVSSIFNNQKICVVCESSVKIYDNQLNLIQEISHDIKDFLCKYQFIQPFRLFKAQATKFLKIHHNSREKQPASDDETMNNMKTKNKKLFFFFFLIMALILESS